MAVYLLVDVNVLDDERYADYRATPSTAGEHGGRFIVRGGATEVWEAGDWAPSRVAVMEFPDADAARAWYDSDAYRQKRAIRHEAARTTILLVEGLE